MSIFRQVVDDLRYIVHGMTSEQGQEILEGTEDELLVEDTNSLAPILPPVQDVRDDN